MEVKHESRHYQVARVLDLELVIAKSTILAHLVRVRGQDLQGLEQDLEKSRTGPDTHIFHGK